MNRDFNDMRQDYEHASLDIEHVHTSPYLQFDEWFEQAKNSIQNEPNAMSLATVSGEGKPSCRIVLLKEVIDHQFVFYTNYESRKAQELGINDHAALLFYWYAHERQVRIEGIVTKAPDAISDRYFKTRPRDSRIGANASPQSQVIDDREILENKVADLEKQYKDDNDIPRPEFWGGYMLNAERFEFWQGRRSRLHDRIVYEKAGNSWNIFRLAP